MVGEDVSTTFQGGTKEEGQAQKQACMIDMARMKKEKVSIGDINKPRSRFLFESSQG